MNQKYNPYVSLVALLLLALILVLTCTGCTKESTTIKNDRFAFIRYYNGTLPDCYVITDKNTGTEYLYVDDGYGGGICKMEG